MSVVVVDDGLQGSTSRDQYAIRVLDKTGQVFLSVGSWSGSTYQQGANLEGGNIKVHLT